MSRNTDILINGLTILYLITISIIIHKKMLRKFEDYFLSFVLILAGIFMLFSKNKQILDLAHFLFCGIYLIGITLFSSNKYLLYLNSLMICVVIGTRYYYKCCLLNIRQGHTGTFVGLNKKLKLDWNVIFPILLILTLGKLMKFA
jgi:hypothetical protein